MMSSLFSGVSGLRNHQVKMNVIGNNISNVNTIGFKGGRVTFQEALIQTLKGAGRPSAISGGTNPVQIGLGMQVAAIDTLHQQGGLETTGQITDLAIQGSGFFVLSDGHGEYYTRSGAFGFDAESYLVDPASGMKVQGRMADGEGNIPAVSTIGDINLPFGQQDPANPTTTISLANNLDSSATDARILSFEAGTTNIDQVTGIAVDGAGGRHNVQITNSNPGYNPGGQAVRSTFDPTALAGVANLYGSMTENTTLGDLGVTDFSGFTITVDGLTTTTLEGYDANTRVSEVVDDLNQISGVDAELVANGVGNFEVKLTRSFAGDNASFNITSSNGAVGNVLNRMFGLDGAGIASVGGLDHTFQILDTFTPTGKASEAAIELDVLVNAVTGLAEGIGELGEGGVTIKTSNPDGLATGTLEIETAPTQHSTSITSYDSQGGRHTVIVTFTKTTTDNLWDWQVTLPGEELLLEGSTGTVRFNTDGSLLTFQYNGGANSLRFDPGNGAETVEINFQAGDTAAFNGLTGFASPFTTSAIYQDGYGMGILEKISIDQAGTITGIFSNGISRTLAQIIVADFNNKGGLLRTGNSMFQVSANSGSAIHGVAGETVAGTISSGALESSNVDIAQEFTSMITAQRGFQANARIITTSDNMLDELVNLKR